MVAVNLKADVSPLFGIIMCLYCVAISDFASLLGADAASERVTLCGVVSVWLDAILGRVT